MKWLGFITLFKIELLLPFTGIRNVLEEMPERGNPRLEIQRPNH